MSLKRIFAFAILILIGHFLPGCADPVGPASLIARPRVLGARVAVAGDPARAWPRPGEAADVTWLVATPDRPHPLAWSLRACLAAPGGARCADGALPFAAADGASDGGAAPIFTLVAPADGALGGATEIFVSGVICADGTPAAAAGEDDGAPIGRRCAGDAAVETDATLAITIQTGDATNESPSLADATVTLDGQAWPAAPGAAGGDAGGCAGAAAAIVATTDKRHVTIAIDGAARESLPPPAARETLQLSQFSTGGELDRQFDVVTGADSDPVDTITVDWQPPKLDEIPDGGLLVDFTFVARDMRGGADWTSRTLCVTRP